MIFKRHQSGFLFFFFFQRGSQLHLSMNKNLYPFPSERFIWWKYELYSEFLYHHWSSLIWNWPACRPLPHFCCAVGLRSGGSPDFYSFALRESVFLSFFTLQHSSTDEKEYLKWVDVSLVKKKKKKSVRLLIPWFSLKRKKGGKDVFFSLSLSYILAHRNWELFN